jgi:hypothetical protein
VRETKENEKESAKKPKAAAKKDAAPKAKAEPKEAAKVQKSPKAEPKKSPKAAPAPAPAAAGGGGDNEAEVKAVGDEIRTLKEKLKSEGLSGKKVNDHEEVKALVAKLQELKKAGGGDTAGTHQ